MSAASLPAARLMAFSMFSFERFCALALLIATRSGALDSGSGPPFFAAMVMDLASFGNTLDIVAHRDSFARRRHSKALPMVCRGECVAPPRSVDRIQGRKRGGFHLVA